MTFPIPSDATLKTFKITKKLKLHMKPPVVRVNSDRDEVFYTNNRDDDPASLQVPHLNYQRAEHDEKAKVSNAKVFFFVLLFFLVTTACSTVN